MDLTTLSPTFLADQPVDQFVSAIWTERYSKKGDCQIVVPATAENIAKLAEGTYLALHGSKEVMQIETQNIENQLLTAVGETLDSAILGERFIWAPNPEFTTGSDPNTVPRIADITDDTRKPGEFMSHLVDLFVINPVTFDTAHAPATLDWAMEQIPELSLGDIDHSGDVTRLTAATGPLYDALEKLATDNKRGFSLYLDSADATTGFRLKFKTYAGQDRSSAQTVNPLVRLTPELDGISGIKEVRSIAQFKNVVYVYYKGEIHKYLADPDAPEPEGLDRRVLVTDAQGEPVGRKLPPNQWQWGGSSYTQTVIGPTEIAAFLDQNAKDALANHNYVRSIDGETSPISDYKFGTDYFLGDTIELEGLTGAISKAQITEYIRSQDKSGEKSYPTISVVDGGGG